MKLYSSWEDVSAHFPPELMTPDEHWGITQHRLSLRPHQYTGDTRPYRRSSDIRHRAAVIAAMEAGKPVSSAAVKFYKLKLT